jgi:hypothetical protein
MQVTARISHGGVYSILELRFVQNYDPVAPKEVQLENDPKMVDLVNVWDLPKKFLFVETCMYCLKTYKKHSTLTVQAQRREMRPVEPSLQPVT